MTVAYTQTLWNIAIHEAAHVVIRYVLMGNIDIIEYIDLTPQGTSLGRIHELADTKIDDMFEAYMDDLPIGKSLVSGGYFFNECCYSIAGVIAEKIICGFDSIPWEAASEDLDSFYSQMSMVVGICDEEIDTLINAAIPETESLIQNNINLIERVATAVISAKGHRLDNASLLAVLKQ